MGQVTEPDACSVAGASDPRSAMRRCISVAVIGNLQAVLGTPRSWESVTATACHFERIGAWKSRTSGLTADARAPFIGTQSVKVRSRLADLSRPCASRRTASDSAPAAFRAPAPRGYSLTLLSSRRQRYAWAAGDDRG